jgi:hypothetical protein
MGAKSSVPHRDSKDGGNFSGDRPEYAPRHAKRHAGVLREQAPARAFSATDFV